MRKKLFWRLYFLFTVLAVGCIAVTGFATYFFISSRHVDRLERELSSNARLISILVEDHLGSDNAKVQQAVESLGGDFKPRVTVILDDGVVVGESERAPQGMENHADRREVRLARENGSGAAERTSPTLDVPMLYVAVRVGPGENPRGFVRCALPMTEVRERLAGLSRVILLCCGIGAILALVVSALVSRQITRPIEHMTRVAADITEGRFESKAYVTAKSEIGLLAGALNSMRARLVEQIGTIEHDHRQLETILSTMTEGVVAMDARGRILFLNDTAGEMLGASPTDARGKPLWEINRNPALAELLEEAVRSGKTAASQWSRDDRKYEIVVVPVAAAQSEETAEDDKPSHILVIRDVTSLRKLERMRMDFIANVSHELKSPLTSIKGFVETLRAGAADDPEKSAEFLAIIERHATRLDNLVADLLKLSALESPDFQPDRIPLSLEEIVRKTVALFAPKIAEKNLSAEVIAEPNLPTVEADRSRMEQVFTNLLDNAIMYTGEGGGIEIKIERAGESIQVEVRDTGIGIPGKDLPRIFERFYRVDKARSREMGGTGLGLAIVKHIILQHGGAIRAESAPGRGTSVIFIIPAC